MPAPEVESLAQRDPGLVGLATLLDPAAFAAATGGGPTPRIVYVRYKPGRRCLVAYRAAAGAGPADRYAQALPEASWAKYEQLYGRDTTGPRLLRDARIALFPFPHDRKLSALVRLLDDAERPSLLAKLLGDAPSADLAIEPLGYKPERRFVGQLHRGRDPRYVVKCYTPLDFRRARENAKPLVSRGPLRLMRAAGRSERHGLVALEWLPGTPLIDLLRSGALPSDELRRTGAALAELHGQKSKHLAPLERTTEAASLRQIASDLAWLLPDETERLWRLANLLAAGLAEAPPVERPIHGDFYARQVILQAETAGIIDLDEAARGDPLLDLGNFLAHQDRYVQRDGLPAAQVDEIAEAFLAGYATVSPGVDLGRLELYRAACLLRLAPHPFRHAEADWPRATRTILDRVEQLSSQFKFAIRPTKSASGVDGASLYADQAFGFLHEALDPMRALPEIVAATAGYDELRGPWRIDRIRVARHKPGRRCLLEYTLEGPNGAPTFVVLAKSRAKGLDRAAHDIQRALFERGLAVPEPVGCSAKFRLWLQRSVDGVSATSRLLAGDESLAARCAELLFQLHATPAVTTRSHGLDAELEILRARLETFANAHPLWASRAGELLEMCRAEARGYVARTTCGIHRDFYPDHVLVGADRLYLVDVDLYSVGDPALDVGNFVGHLIEHGLRDQGDSRRYANVGRAFADRYQQLARADMEDAIAFHTLLTLARHVELSTRFPDRRETTVRLLDVCESGEWRRRG